jgi:hypothetical protein
VITALAVLFHSKWNTVITGVLYASAANTPYNALFVLGCEMAEIHYFDINVAKLYGVNCAVILQNIWHWIKKNEANGKNFHDGTYWTYNSTKAFAELFPYLTQKQIETALKKLRDEEIIITGNYNTLKYDRTLWYAVTEKGKCILLTGEMDITSKGNGNPPEGKPIPDINPDSKPSSKPNKRNKKPFVPPTLDEVEAYCKERKNNVDAKKFFDYFNASDWVDSNGKEVRNWKQKVITWESYAKPTERNNTNGQNTGDSNKPRVGHYV